MKDNPYRQQPDYAYWRRSVAAAPSGALDPVVDPVQTIGSKERIATAGSCFAQHIGRYLEAAERNYLVSEPPHPIMGVQSARMANYGVFTARYGNIYTARQLAQLFDRAYGRFKPCEDIWQEAGSIFIDPFRPNIQPGGFNSERAFFIDRDLHFKAVRSALETLDVLIFTLGLTEAWISKDDGAVFPLCPGVAGGTFDPRRHAFINFGVDETVADLRYFIEALRSVNSKARIILTVSPVPLAATAEQRHVLVSTVYSKSVLRVACEMLVNSMKNVAYFPSYEIVASGFAGDYFGEDRRSVTPEGVAHVMRVFSQHFLADQPKRGLTQLLHRATAIIRTPSLERDNVWKVMCDEEALDMQALERDDIK